MMDIGCVGQVEPFHKIENFGFRGFDQEMEVVSHQDIGIQDDIVDFQSLFQDFQVPRAVPVIHEKSLPIIATHRIESTFKF